MFVQFKISSVSISFQIAILHRYRLEVRRAEGYSIESSTQYKTLKQARAKGRELADTFSREDRADYQYLIYKDDQFFEQEYAYYTFEARVVFVKDRLFK